MPAAAPDESRSGWPSWRYDCVGVDVDPAMLARARRTAPDLPWWELDLADLALVQSGAAAPSTWWSPPAT